MGSDPPTKSVERDAFLSGIQRRLGLARISDRAFSTSIGRNPGWFSSIIARGGIPNALDLYRMAAFFNCLMDELFAGVSDRKESSFASKMTDRLNAVRNSQGFSRPSIPDVMTWFVEHGGQLTNDDRLKDYYDLFGPPDLDAMQPVTLKVGHRSLAAIHVDLLTTDDLDNFVAACEEDVRVQMVRSHAKVLQSRKPDVQPMALSLEIEGGFTVSVSYLRLLLPVVTEQKEIAILNYCFPTAVQEVIIDAVGSSSELPEKRSPHYVVRESRL